MRIFNDIQKILARNALFELQKIIPFKRLESEFVFLYDMVWSSAFSSFENLISRIIDLSLCMLAPYWNYDDISRGFKFRDNFQQCRSSTCDVKEKLTCHLKKRGKLGYWETWNLKIVSYMINDLVWNWSGFLLLITCSYI